MKASAPRFAGVSRLDRAIASVFPRWGLSRISARSGLGMAAGVIERRAGGMRGGYRDWKARYLSRFEQARSRETLALRALELVANDGLARSAKRTIQLYAVGRGLTPRSQPKVGMLGITQEQARKVAERAEWCWKLFAKKADVTGRYSMARIQFRNVGLLATLGENLRLVCMPKPRPDRPISLALQILDPLRLKTPSGLRNDQAVRDGIQLGPCGEPQKYFISIPKDGGSSLGRSDFKAFPREQGHRPVIMHAFLDDDEPEQYRGWSPLSTCMKLLKNLEEYYDVELMAAITAGNFPVHLETPSDAANSGVVRGLKQDKEGKRFWETAPGQITYGPEKPHILANPRPSGTFPEFSKSNERRAAASQGVPHILAVKDFTETTYSGGRLAQMDFWQLASYFRTLEIETSSQPTWEMVFEEGVCRGFIEIPGGIDAFYENPEAWTNATWTGVGKGLLDPNKEMQAYTQGLETHVLNLAHVHAELGLDHEEMLAQREREVRDLEARGLWTRSKISAQSQAQNPDQDSEEDDARQAD